MPLKMFVITCLIFVSLCSQAAVQVVYRISKVHGLFNFTMAISGRFHQSPVLKEMQKISEKVPALKRYLKEILNLKARTFVSWIGENSKPYVVIRADQKEDFKDAAEKMKSLGQIDPRFPIQNY